MLWADWRGRRSSAPNAAGVRRIRARSGCGNAFGVGGGIAGGYRQQRGSSDQENLSIPERACYWPGLNERQRGGICAVLVLGGTIIRQTRRPWIQGGGASSSGRVAGICGVKRVVELICLVMRLNHNYVIEPASSITHCQLVKCRAA